jgi:uncharacterized protein (TIGR03083 family)
MTLPTAACLSAIAEHSAGVVAAAPGHLDAPVESCPGWTMADLVWHLTEVHWFWGTIVAELLPSRPPDERRPARPGDGDLVAGLETQARRLVEALGAADQSAHCWTWAGWQQDVAFVTRHQVQEAVVHHWDAVHAVGGHWTARPEVAVDSIDEFLHFSVASDDDPDDPVVPPLEGTLAFRCTDTGDAWTLTDGARPGTARVGIGAADGAPLVEAPAADLLLWLYGRALLDTSAVPEDLLARFRAMCFTD